MKKFELEFYDSQGTVGKLGTNEIMFFVEPLSVKKVWHGLFVLSRLVRKKSFAVMLLFIKGAYFALFKPKTMLSLEEYFQLWAGMLGFTPTMVGCTFGDNSIKLDFNQIFTQSYWGLVQIVIMNQYNISTSSLNGATVLDAGANTGIFSIYAALRGARQVYAFEPLYETYIQLKRNIQLNGLEEVVVPINKALGKVKGKGKIYYSYAGDGSATIEFSDKTKKTQDIKITTIDSTMVGKGQVNFIKIDAEGSEANILLGGKKTIRKFKPVLSFSAYHRKEDKAVLPKVVWSIRADYKCTLNSKCEEDFYCV